MKNIKILSLVLLISGLQTLSTTVQAADKDYEEISYEDLIDRLSTKKKNFIPRAEDPFETVKIHAGIGFINSFSYFKIKNSTYNRHQNGIQLSVGMDLFTPQWYSEGSFKNFGLTESGSEEWTIREFDVRIGFKEQIARPWGYHLHAGLANRFYSLKDELNGISAEGQTPSLLAGLGIHAQVNPNLSFGFELNGKNALINNTEDKGSVDMIFKVNASM